MGLCQKGPSFFSLIPLSAKTFFSFTLDLGKATLHNRVGTERHLNYSLCPQGAYKVPVRRILTQKAESIRQFRVSDPHGNKFCESSEQEEL